MRSITTTAAAAEDRAAQARQDIWVKGEILGKSEEYRGFALG